MNGFMSNSDWDIVGMRLPNGKIQVVKNRYGSSGEVFESDEDFYDKYRHFITEKSDSSNVTCGIISSING